MNRVNSEYHAHRLRAERFKDCLEVEQETEGGPGKPSGSRSPRKLKGFSTKLEKPYLRLTTAPRTSTIRPLRILKLALENVKEKYAESDDYEFACEQLKSIRQDLTVQHIENRFAAHAYETHARIALECGDLEGLWCIGAVNPMYYVLQIEPKMLSPTLPLLLLPLSLRRIQPMPIPVAGATVSRSTNLCR